MRHFKTFKLPERRKLTVDGSFIMEPQMSKKKKISNRCRWVRITPMTKIHPVVRRCQKKERRNDKRRLRPDSSNIWMTVGFIGRGWNQFYMDFYQFISNQNQLSFTYCFYLVKAVKLPYTKPKTPTEKIWNRLSARRTIFFELFMITQSNEFIHYLNLCSSAWTRILFWRYIKHNC